ncbi:MAG: DNA alkylation repair protein [Clostridiales bacterium]|nr:DNA alkylation repair protein [Clostridiales bacterium]
MTRIQELLFEFQDKKYADFQSNLTPTLSRERFIGVRTPKIRALAKKLAAVRKIAESPDNVSLVEEFMKDLPHFYFEENQLHAFLIAEEKDFSACLRELELFLPYIDNWATCDQLSPGVFKKEPEKLLPYIELWLDSSHIYTVRFGIGMLMRYFLDDRFELKYAEEVAAIPSDRDYYISMMIAWYFATALAKQYDAVLPFIKERRLDPWTHNKTIQKAVESDRIPPERKSYLKTLKRPSH